MSDPDNPNLPDIDFNGALRRVGGKETLLLKLLRSFLSKYRDANIQISSHVEAKEFEEARRLSHQIKGAAANLGANLVSEHAKSIEIVLKNGEEHVDNDALQALDDGMRSLEYEIGRVFN